MCLLSDSGPSPTLRTHAAQWRPKQLWVEGSASWRNPERHKASRANMQSRVQKAPRGGGIQEVPSVEHAPSSGNYHLGFPPSCICVVHLWLSPVTPDLVYFSTRFSSHNSGTSNLMDSHQNFFPERNFIHSLIHVWYFGHTNSPNTQQSHRPQPSLTAWFADIKRVSHGWHDCQCRRSRKGPTRCLALMSDCGKVTDPNTHMQSSLHASKRAVALEIENIFYKP